jgi:hypothetical protein
MRGRDAQRRPRTLLVAPLKDADGWMEPFRQFWEQKFASLDEYLRQTQKAETPKKRKARNTTQQGGPR